MAKMFDEKGNLRPLAEMKRSLADLHAAQRQKRVAAFVDPPHAQALIEQLRPLREVLTQYLALTNDAKRLIPFNTADFDRYEQRIILVRQSTDANQAMYAEMLRRSIAVISEAQSGEVAVSYVVGKIYRYLALADGALERSKHKAYKGADLPEIVAGYWAHYMEERRLSHEIH